MTDDVERIKGERNAAIMLGEQRCNEMFALLHELRRMRRQIRLTIHLLKTGRAVDALTMLQSMMSRDRI